MRQPPGRFFLLFRTSRSDRHARIRRSGPGTGASPGPRPRMRARAGRGAGAIRSMAGTDWSPHDVRRSERDRWPASSATGQPRGSRRRSEVSQSSSGPLSRIRTLPPLSDPDLSGRPDRSRTISCDFRSVCKIKWIPPFERSSGVSAAQTPGRDRAREIRPGAGLRNPCPVRPPEPDISCRPRFRSLTPTPISASAPGSAVVAPPS